MALILLHGVSVDLLHYAGLSTGALADQEVSQLVQGGWKQNR